LSVRTADVIICGAGLAGISAGYHLAVRHGTGRILLVDEGPPLALTSDKSSEGYRNWWPGFGCAPGAAEPLPASSAMVRLVDRSIDILEALARDNGNAFHMNRRGYLYVTADPARAAAMRSEAEQISALGAGPLRCYPGDATSEASYRPAPSEDFEDQPTGADFIADPALLREHFPYLAGHTVAALHVRRAGWLSAQQLGMYLLEQARAHGVELVRARVTGVRVTGGRVAAVHLAGAGGDEIVATRCLVNAAGPLCREVGRLVGVELPVFAELHAKVAFNDSLGALPREAPLTIWADSQHLAWRAEEAEAWAESPDTAWLLKEFPPGVHGRPEGGPGSRTVLLLWAYHTPPVEATWPPAFDPLYAELTLRGMATMVPALRPYVDRLPRVWIDGGYYLKTRENRPLIGPLPVGGAHFIGALSGFGVMACCAAGELLALHVAGDTLPEYAPAFTLERYADPAYLDAIEHLDDGQL
jgi:sarcosine oxidase, subunit beta